MTGKSGRDFASTGEANPKTPMVPDAVNLVNEVERFKTRFCVEMGGASRRKNGSDSEDRDDTGNF